MGVYLKRIGPDGEGLRCLQCLPQLYYLSLDNYKESEDFLAHLRKLTQIKWLALDRPSSFWMPQ